MIRLSDIKYASLHRTTSIALRSPCDINETRETLEEHVFRSFSNRQRVLQIILDAYEKLIGQKFINQFDSIVNRHDNVLFTTPLRRSNAGGLGTNHDSRAEERNTSESVNHDDLDFQSSPRQRTNTDQSQYSINNSIASDYTHDTSISEIPRNLHQEWQNVKKNSVDLYSEVAVHSQTVPISLMDYYKSFIADDAPHSMALFQANIIKDTNVQATPWNEINNVAVATDKGGEEHYEEYKRTSTSLHNRKARVGPASVPLERKQTYRKYASHGIAVNTVLKMEGIPYGDTFEVQDEWIVEAGENGDNVAVSVRFRIHFIAKPPMKMIRKVITAECKKEFESWFKLYMAMVHSAVSGVTQVVRDDTIQKDEGGAGSNALLFDWSWFANGMNVFVIVLSVALYHILSLRHRVEYLETELYHLQLNNERVMELLDAIVLEREASNQCTM